MTIKKLIPSKFIIIVFFTTLVLLALTYNLWINKFFYITFQINSEEDTQIKLFYTQRLDSFNEEQSILYNAKAGQHKIKMIIPTPKISKFCLDFTDNSGKIKISDLTIRGRKITNFSDFSKFHFQNITNYKEKNGTLSFNNTHHSSRLIYKEELDLKGGRHIDFYALIILTTIYFLCSYKIIRYLSYFKIEQHHSRIDIVFLTIFFSLLFIPMLHISDAEKSEQENRMLAEKPKFSKLYSKNKNFGKSYEEWFNDRFFGRKTLIDLHDEIIYSFSQNGNKDVLIGKQGWLFYRGDNSLRNYQNLDLFTEAELKKITQYLNDIQTWAVKNNKRFYFLIGPDKNKIYGEYIHILKQINRNEKSRANQLIKYLTTHTNIKVIYPYHELHKAKKNGFLYWKNDTHWNEMGAFIAYKSLSSIISQDVPLSILTYNSLIKKKNPKGDLSRMYASIKNDNTTEYSLPNIQNKSECDSPLHKGKLTRCINPKKKHTLYVYRDSFSTALAPYLNNTFGKVTYFWRHSIQESDLEILKKDADVIILEIVERGLPSLINLHFPKE